MKILKVIRKFERFNFHGVPEGPELSFERDRYSQYTERQTGQSLNTSEPEIDYDNAVFLGYLKDDFKKKIETFIPAE
ncbi:MAG: hypothetical protein IPO70_08730 [Bacteroidetes bacterium]|nr:hypothetical protein [Bacteroidota bacterium]